MSAIVPPATAAPLPAHSEPADAWPRVRRRRPIAKNVTRRLRKSDPLPSSPELTTRAAATARAEAESYWQQARQPFTCLLFLAPLLIAYELGVLWMGGPHSDLFRNGADGWMRSWLYSAGIHQSFVLPIVVLALLLIWNLYGTRKWMVAPETIAGMLAESMIFAFLLVLGGQLSVMGCQAAGLPIMLLPQSAPIQTLVIDPAKGEAPTAAAAPSTQLSSLPDRLPRFPSPETVSPVESPAPEARPAGYRPALHRVWDRLHAKPVATSEPVAPSEPAAAPELATTSGPVATPEPVVTAEPVVTPEPVVAVKPVVTPEPVATPEPAAIVEPVATAEPVSTVEPVATPESAAPPESAATPDHVAILEPVENTSKVAPVDGDSLATPVLTSPESVLLTHGAEPALHLPLAAEPLAPIASSAALLPANEELAGDSFAAEPSDLPAEGTDAAAGIVPTPTESSETEFQKTGRESPPVFPAAVAEVTLSTRLQEMVPPTEIDVLPFTPADGERLIAFDIAMPEAAEPASPGGLQAEHLKPTIARALTFVGAGIYEEVLFRLLLLPAGFFLFRLLRLSNRASTVLAILSTSLCFALAHYIGPAGDALVPYTFCFRTLAGVYFALLFLTRGFGITVGAHACYDLIIGVLWY